MNWYCLTTPPQREFKARDALDALGLETLCPVEYRRRRKNAMSNAIVVYAAPAIPGYVVARITDDAWSDVIRIEDQQGRRLIRGALGSEGIARPLPALALAALRTLHQTEPVVSVSKGIMVGDIVIIQGGPFDGHRCRVTRKEGATVAVILNLFGSMREIAIDQARLALAA